MAISPPKPLLAHLGEWFIYKTYHSPRAQEGKMGTTSVCLTKTIFPTCLL